MKVLILTGKDFDDLEGMYPYYRLLEENVDAVVASNEQDFVCAKYHAKLPVMTSFEKVDTKQFDGLIIPGGKAPEKLRNMEIVTEITKQFFEEGKPIAAICHGQQILISAEILKDKRATCYPGIKKDLQNAGAIYIDKEVVVDKNLITSRRPEDLPFFMREFIKVLKGETL